MVAPLVVAGGVFLGRMALTWGARWAARKIGQKAAQKGGQYLFRRIGLNAGRWGRQRGWLGGAMWSSTKLAGIAGLMTYGSQLGLDLNTMVALGGIGYAAASGGLAAAFGGNFKLFEMLAAAVKGDGSGQSTGMGLPSMARRTLSPSAG